MSRPVEVPRFSKYSDRVKLVEWLKKPGDPVSEDEPIAIVESNKSAIEVRAPCAGTMDRLLFKPGEWCRVEEPFCLFA